MQKQILFRGQRVDDLEWVEGNYLGGIAILPIGEMDLDMFECIHESTLQILTDSGEWKSINEVKIS